MNVVNTQSGDYFVVVAGLNPTGAKTPPPQKALKNT
jgi:hypothetical protein